MFFETTSQGIIIRVRLQPNSSCCKVSGLFTSPEGDEFIKINVISIPEKGKANKELIDWLAKQLKVAKSALTIVSGELDRYKKILINADTASILPRLQNLIKGDTL